MFVAMTLARVGCCWLVLLYKVFQGLLMLAMASQ
jgi:hypothetical protein